MYAAPCVLAGPTAGATACPKADVAAAAANGIKKRESRCLCMPSSHSQFDRSDNRSSRRNWRIRFADDYNDCHRSRKGALGLLCRAKSRRAGRELGFAVRGAESAPNLTFGRAASCKRLRYRREGDLRSPDLTEFNRYSRASLLCKVPAASPCVP